MKKTDDQPDLFERSEELSSPKHAQSEAVVIREAHPSDHMSITSLLGQLGYEATPALILEKLEALGASPTDKTLVATMHGEVVGSISLHALPLFHAAGCLGRVYGVNYCGRPATTILAG